jgi:hypothetical protein
MTPIDVEKDFIEAFEYHPLTLPEYLLYKQKRSGYSREIYFRAFQDEIDAHRLRLRLLIEKQRKLEPNIDKDKIGLSIEELTKGKVKEYYGFRINNKINILNKDVLDTLEFRLEEAYDYDKPKSTYSDLQIISFVDKALKYILGEFEVQAGLKPSTPFTRNYPKGYKSKTEDGEPIYLIHNYAVRTPTPLFDYYLFEESLRNLLLQSNHPELLKPMTKHFFALGKKIVSIWNEHLYPLEEYETKKNVMRSTMSISFDTKERSFTTWVDIDKFSFYSQKQLNNYQLTTYASKVGHIVAEEVPGVDDNSNNSIQEVSKLKPSYLGYALLHHYWYKHSGDESKAITSNTKRRISNDYKISERELWSKVKEIDNSPHDPKPTNHHNSISEFIEQYTRILPILKQQCLDAYNDVTQKLNALQKEK